MSSEHDYNSKILIIGDAGCGKSSLINRYIDGEYNDNYYNTIGVDFKIKHYEKNGKKIKMNIWDTAGQEKYKSLVSSYYRNSDIIILVFDLTNHISFRNIEKWYSDIEYICKKDNLQLFLVGTKADVGKDKYVVDEFMIKEKCLQYNMKYYETSAKKNYNLNELFNDISDIIYNIKAKEEQEKILNILEPPPENRQKLCLECNLM
jgi:small GTP-binding protein